MQALAAIDDVRVVTVAGGIEEDTRAFVDKWQIPHCSLELEDCLAQPGVDAVINTGPSQLHVEHTKLALAHGKHVLLEIPMALNLRDSIELTELEQSSGRVCMVCHTRHFTTGLRQLKHIIDSGDLHLHHIVVQTYFFRRVNLNRFGQPRTWTDDLLWHHACHAVDMTRWLLEDDAMSVWGQVGPLHPTLRIPMDLTIGMKSPRTGAIATIAHSFNNHGEIQTPMRFIGEEATYQFVGGVLTDHEGTVVASGNMQDAVVRQNLQFLRAIRTGSEPETSFRNCLKSMEYLNDIQSIL